jgi:putative peptidoglycan lipid II flippase
MTDSSNKNSLFKPTLLVAGLTSLSRIVGLIRDVLISNVLGVSYITDIFIVALRIPNIFRRITAEGAFSSAFIPMFSKKLTLNKFSAIKFSEDILFASLVVMILITSLLQILMPFIIYFIAYGFIDDPVKFDLAINFSRITTPYILLVSLSSIGIGILNSLGRYFASSFVPIIFNAVLVSVLLLPIDNITSVGYLMSFGVIISGIIQFILVFYFLYKSGYILKLKRPENLNLINKFSVVAKPQIITGLVMQANIVLSGIIASFVEGGISILYYAERLYQLPLALFGISIGTVLLPTLSSLDIRKDFDKINPVITNIIKFSLIMIIPSAVGLSIISVPLISVIYEHGMFSEINTVNVSKALIAFSLGLPAFVLIKIYLPIFYSIGDTKTPLFYSIISISINLILALLLFQPIGIVGIALSTSISSWLNLFLLMSGSKKYNINISLEKIYRDLFKIILSVIFMSLYIIIISKFLFHLPLISQLVFLVISASIIYFLVLFVLGVFNKNDIISIIKN